MIELVLMTFDLRYSACWFTSTVEISFEGKGHRSKFTITRGKTLLKLSARVFKLFFFGAWALGLQAPEGERPRYIEAHELSLAISYAIGCMMGTMASYIRHCTYSIDVLNCIVSASVSHFAITSQAVDIRLLK